MELVKTINGLAVIKEDDGYRLELRNHFFESVKEAEELLKKHDIPVLTDNAQVSKMFEMGLIRNISYKDRQHIIREEWRLSRSDRGFSLSSEGDLLIKAAFNNQGLRTRLDFQSRDLIFYPVHSHEKIEQINLRNLEKIMGFDIKSISFEKEPKEKPERREFEK